MGKSLGMSGAFSVNRKKAVVRAELVTICIREQVTGVADESVGNLLKSHDEQ
jgi:hypothetical protein